MARLKERVTRLHQRGQQLAPRKIVAIFLHRILYDSIDAVGQVAGNEAATALQAQSWRQYQALADGLPLLVPHTLYLKTVRTALQILQDLLPDIVAAPQQQRACYGAMRDKVLVLRGEISNQN